jgi:hypothetical protein
MANVKLVFSGTETSKTQDHNLVCYLNTNNNIYIRIEEYATQSSHICLDRATAIKLHRELKKQISFIKSEEVYNG